MGAGSASPGKLVAECVGAAEAAASGNVVDGQLKRFYVVPEQRGAGVADALVSELTRYAAAHDAEVLQLETGDQQRAAIAFYRRHGFVEVPPFGPYVGSETSICMRRRLARP